MNFTVIVIAFIVWMVVRAVRRAVAKSKRAYELEQQHSPTASHTGAARTTAARTTAGTFLDPVNGRPRETGITDHKGPFLQFRR